jgi:hypothetical protein
MPCAPPLPLPEPSGPLPAVPDAVTSMTIREVRPRAPADTLESMAAVGDAGKQQNPESHAVGCVSRLFPTRRFMWHSSSVPACITGSRAHDKLSEPPMCHCGAWCLALCYAMSWGSTHCASPSHPHNVPRPALLCCAHRWTGSCQLSRRRPLRH